MKKFFIVLFALAASAALAETDYIAMPRIDRFLEGQEAVVGAIPFRDQVYISDGTYYNPRIESTFVTRFAKRVWNMDTGSPATNVVGRLVTYAAIPMVNNDWAQIAGFYGGVGANMVGYSGIGTRLVAAHPTNSTVKMEFAVRDVNAAVTAFVLDKNGPAQINAAVVDDKTVVPEYPGQILIGESNRVWVSKGRTTNDWIILKGTD